MDPNACLATFTAALAIGDLDIALEAAGNLTTWVRSGGFLPAGYRTPGAVLSAVRSGLAQACNLRGILRPAAHAIPR